MDKPECTGLGSDGDHCCYLGGVECQHLVRNEGGRRYACGLMLKYGSWIKMEQSEEYQSVGEYWEAHPDPSITYTYCRDFNPIFCCRPELRDGIGNHNQPLYVERYGKF
jgi:hypothetical protein